MLKCDEDVEIGMRMGMGDCIGLRFLFMRSELGRGVESDLCGWSWRSNIRV